MSSEKKPPGEALNEIVRRYLENPAPISMRGLAEELGLNYGTVRYNIKEATFNLVDSGLVIKVGDEGYAWRTYDTLKGVVERVIDKYSDEIPTYSVCPECGKILDKTGRTKTSLCEECAKIVTTKPKIMIDDALDTITAGVFRDYDERGVKFNDWPDKEKLRIYIEIALGRMEEELQEKDLKNSVLSILEKFEEKGGATVADLSSELGISQSNVKYGLAELLNEDKIWEPRAGRFKRFLPTERGRS